MNECINPNTNKMIEALGGGDDELNGTHGSDIYHYRLGDGNDTIIDLFIALR